MTLSTLRAVSTDADTTREIAERLLKKWAITMRAHGLAERTVRERPRIVGAMATAVRIAAHQLEPEDIVDYLALLHTPSTRQTYYSALAAWHQWLVLTGVREDDPMASIRRPRAPRREPRPVATAHIERLLDSGIRRRTQAAVLICAYQGLRVHEAAKIRGEDIDLLGATLRVVGKGGVDATLPLHPVIAELAGDYPRRGYWFPSPVHENRPIGATSLSAVISRAMSRCGIPGTAHSLRHWFGTELVASDVNARVVQTMMRHASLATTAQYIRVDVRQQRNALSRLPSVVLPSEIAG